MKPTLCLIGCGLCLVGSLFLLFEQGFRFNLTASIPRGLYRVVEVQAVERGDLVSFCLAESASRLALERGYLRCGSCPDGSQPLLKIVAGLPGDAVDTCPEGVLVNGRLQPCSSPRALDSHQRPMPSDLVPGRIPEGKALVLSDRHSGGFDGRYFGLVSMAALHKVQPVRIFTPK